MILSGGTRIHADDGIIELHVWNEHFPRFPEKISGFCWPERVRQQMSSSRHRLALYIRTNPRMDRVCALRMNVALADERPANALARLLLMAGFEPGAAPRRMYPLRWLDSLWVWLLTWAYNPRALTGWHFSRVRHQFWITRSHFLALYGDRPAQTEVS